MVELWLGWGFDNKKRKQEEILKVSLMAGFKVNNWNHLNIKLSNISHCFLSMLHIIHLHGSIWFSKDRRVAAIEC